MSSYCGSMLLIVREWKEEIKFYPISSRVEGGIIYQWTTIETIIFILTMKQLIAKLMKKADVLMDPIYSHIPP